MNDIAPAAFRAGARLYLTAAHVPRLVGPTSTSARWWGPQLSTPTYP